MRLPEWFPGVRAHRIHAEAWRPELRLESNGSTVFASLTEAAIREKLSELGAEIGSYRRHLFEEEPEPFRVAVEIRLTYPAIEMWISADQVELYGAGLQLILERWDSDNPEQARRQVLAALENVLAATKQS